MAINPYQPPTTPPARDAQPPIWDIGEHGPIRFSGQPTDEDLSNYLSAHDNVGCVGIGLCVGVVLFSNFWLAFLAIPGAVPIVLGISLVVAITGFVSTRLYRRISFVSMNPHWQEQVSGELRADGVLIKRQHSELFVRWDCLFDVVAGNSVVGLLMMPQVSESLVIGEQMLERPVNEQQVNQFVRQIRQQLISRGSMDARRQFLDALLREKHRDRSIPVPPDAISFSGSVFRHELTTARSESNNGRTTVEARQRRFLMSRPVFVISFLVLGLALILGGVLHAVLPNDPMLAQLLTYGLLAIAWFTYRTRAKRENPKAVIQYLYAFANEEGITSDGHAITTSLPWNHIGVLQHDSERIVLRHAKTRRVMVVRRDMFADDPPWRRFVELATQEQPTPEPPSDENS